MDDYNVMDFTETDLSTVEEWKRKACQFSNQSDDSFVSLAMNVFDTHYVILKTTDQSVIQRALKSLESERSIFQISESINEPSDRYLISGIVQSLHLTLLHLTEKNKNNSEQSLSIIEEWKTMACAFSNRSVDGLVRVFFKGFTVMSNIHKTSEHLKNKLALQSLDSELSICLDYEKTKETSIRSLMFGIMECLHLTLRHLIHEKEISKQLNEVISSVDRFVSPNEDSNRSTISANHLPTIEKIEPKEEPMDDDSSLFCLFGAIGDVNTVKKEEILTGQEEGETTAAEGGAAKAAALACTTPDISKRLEETSGVKEKDGGTREEMMEQDVVTAAESLSIPPTTTVSPPPPLFTSPIDISKTPIDIPKTPIDIPKTVEKLNVSLDDSMKRKEKGGGRRELKKEEGEEREEPPKKRFSGGADASPTAPSITPASGRIRKNDFSDTHEMDMCSPGPICKPVTSTPREEAKNDMNLVERLGNELSNQLSMPDDLGDKTDVNYEDDCGNSDEPSIRRSARNTAKSVKDKEGEGLTCEICDDAQSGKISYLLHLQAQHGLLTLKGSFDIKAKLPFTCDKCTKRFWTYEGLQRHLLMSYGEVTWDLLMKEGKNDDGGRCNICSKNFSSKLLSHLATDHQMKLSSSVIHACDLCSFKCHRMLELTVHTEMHTPQSAAMTTPQCVSCQSHPTTVARYARHLRDAHKTTLRKSGLYLLCDLCGFRVNSEFDLGRHDKECNDRGIFSLHHY